MHIRKSMIVSAAVLRLSITPLCRAFSLVRRKNPALLTFQQKQHQQRQHQHLVSNINIHQKEELHNKVFFHRIQSTILYGKNSNDDDDDGNEMKEGGTTVKPTWTYVPYKPPPPGRKKGPNRYQNGQQPRRNFHSRNNDNWVVPNKVSIPEDKIEMSFTRSSGAGGQNVNKVNTQVVVKFNVMKATWLPQEVRQRIAQNESNRINKDGFFIINSQEYRTQAQNRKDVLDKLQDIILKNYPRPKVRKMRKGVSKKAKVINKEQKRWKSEVKKNRKRVDF